LNQRQQLFVAAAIALCLAFCVSCRTGPPLPAADLSASGWHVQQGQAVWKPPGHRPELAGDLLFATNAAGDCFIQFSKTPFTMATAQITLGAWQIDFGSGRYVFRGRGVPPKRFIWFQLPRAFGPMDLGRPWKFTRRPDESWRLENSRTGEFLDGVFFS
jgi:hypothetical protein